MWVVTPMINEGLLYNEKNKTKKEQENIFSKGVFSVLALVLLVKALGMFFRVISFPYFTVVYPSTVI